jgi:hypothetical protein
MKSFLILLNLCYLRSIFFIILKWNADDADEADNYDFKKKSVLILLNLCYLRSIFFIILKWNADNVDEGDN